jgi:hypothetical protein
VFTNANVTVPGMQIVNESSTAQWINLAQRMAGNGLGWTGSVNDVAFQIQPWIDLLAAGQVNAFVDRLNLLLYAGRMSASLKQDLIETLVSVSGDAASNTNRVRAALFLALASSEYLVQH